MATIIIKCPTCNKNFTRSRGQYNEAKRLNWKQYCSLNCQIKPRLTGKIQTCFNKDCQKKFYRPLKELRKTTKSFCSHVCAATVNNQLRTIGRPVKRCAHSSCGIVISRSQTYCSRVHAAATRRLSIEAYKKRIARKIQSFYKTHRRIPVKREMYGTYRTARKLFGTWNNTIIAAGFEPNPVLFAEKHVAHDGHFCDSMAEKIIDDWLYKNNVPHQRSVPYPGSKRLTADFVVKDRWVEFFGLAGEVDAYDKLIEQKHELCRKNRIALVEIYPKDLFPPQKREKFFTELFS